MRYIITALRAEAAVLIRQLNLKPSDTSLSVYENENTVLAVTGTGPLSASAVCGAVFGMRKISDKDLVINAGIAASVNGGTADNAYVIHKIHDLASGRDYYPDLIPLSSCPEAVLYTGAKPYRSAAAEFTAAEAPVLYDMEGAAVFHAAAMFLPPHRIRLIKVVSDFGETDKLSFRREWAETIAETVLREAEAMETIPPKAEKRMPECSALAKDLHATVAMKRRLEQALRYAELAGIDWQEIVQEYHIQRLLPASDKEAGKQILERLIYELQD